MEQTNGDPLIATTPDDTPRHRDALWSIAVVTDDQALSAYDCPLADMLDQIEQARRDEPGQVVLESALPEIRCLATMLAASRVHWQQNAPAHFTDDADWLAARAQVLALTHVAVTPQQLPLIEQANRRLHRLAARCGQRALEIQPVVLTHRQPAVERVMMHGWSRMPLFEGAQPYAEIGARLSQTLRQRCRERLAPLFAALSHQAA